MFPLDKYINGIIYRYIFEFNYAIVRHEFTSKYANTMYWDEDHFIEWWNYLRHTFWL